MSYANYFMEIVLFPKEEEHLLFRRETFGALALSQELERLANTFYYPDGVVGYHLFDKEHEGMKAASFAVRSGEGSIGSAATHLMGNSEVYRLVCRFQECGDRGFTDILSKPFQSRREMGIWHNSMSSGERFSESELKYIVRKISGVTFYRTLADMCF